MNILIKKAFFFLAENKPYSKAEIRANLHMIKLYFNRQLEDKDGIEIIPRLEAYCVDTAFKEMREEGYEDDGLFDEMKLFFQPLTVTEKELIINKNTLSTLHQEHVAEEKKLTAKMEELKKCFSEKNEQIDTLSNEIEEIIMERDTEFSQYQTDLDKEENESIRKQFELNAIWEARDLQWDEDIDSKKKLRAKYETELQAIENDRIYNENLLKIIRNNLSSNHMIIDRRLVKPHRGFIMYGPPGNNN